MGSKNQAIPILPEPNLPLVDCHCHFPSRLIPRNFKEKNISVELLNEDQYIDFFLKHKGEFIVSSGFWEDLSFLETFVKNHTKILISAGWGAQSTAYASDEEWSRIYPRFFQYLENKSTHYNLIGEIGIDFHHARTDAKRDQQIKIFDEIIQKTKHLGKCYSLHVRNPSVNDIDPNAKKPEYNKSYICNELILDVLDSEGISPSRVMWHCFSGPKEWGPLLAEKGYYISIPSSAYGFKKWRRNIENIPLKNLLVETDASYQHPHSMGAFNTPSNVKYAIAAIAYDRNENQMKIANQVLINAKKFFNFK